MLIEVYNKYRDIDKNFENFIHKNFLNFKLNIFSSIYHYSSLENLNNIYSTKQIYMTRTDTLCKNDEKEILYFYDRYNEIANKNNTLKERNLIELKPPEESIVFVSCFTLDSNSEYMNMNYANSCEKKLEIKSYYIPNVILKFSDIQNKYAGHFYFNRVIYCENCLENFLENMIDFVCRQEYCSSLEYIFKKNLHLASVFFKKEKYRDESEVRLAFIYNEELKKIEDSRKFSFSTASGFVDPNYPYLNNNPIKELKWKDLELIKIKDKIFIPFCLYDENDGEKKEIIFLIVGVKF